MNYEIMRNFDTNFELILRKSKRREFTKIGSTCSSVERKRDWRTPNAMTRSRNEIDLRSRQCCSLRLELLRVGVLDSPETSPVLFFKRIRATNTARNFTIWTGRKVMLESANDTARTALSNENARSVFLESNYRHSHKNYWRLESSMQTLFVLNHNYRLWKLVNWSQKVRSGLWISLYSKDLEECDKIDSDRNQTQRVNSQNRIKHQYFQFRRYSLIYNFF